MQNLYSICLDMFLLKLQQRIQTNLHSAAKISELLPALGVLSNKASGHTWAGCYCLHHCPNTLSSIRKIGVILSTHWIRDVQPLVKPYHKVLIITGNITEVWDQTFEEPTLKWLSSLIRQQELNHFTNLPAVAREPRVCVNVRHFFLSSRNVFSRCCQPCWLQCCL